MKRTYAVFAPNGESTHHEAKWHQVHESGALLLFYEDPRNDLYENPVLIAFAPGAWVTFRERRE